MCYIDCSAYEPVYRCPVTVRLSTACCFVHLLQMCRVLFATNGYFGWAGRCWARGCHVGGALPGCPFHLQKVNLWFLCPRNCMEGQAWVHKWGGSYLSVAPWVYFRADMDMKNGIPWCLSCYQPLCLPVSSSLSALVFWSHIINCDACHTEDLYMACKSVQVSSRGIVPRTHGCWSNPWTFKFWIKHCFTTEDACPWWELWMQRVGVETSVCNMYVSPQPLQSRLLRSVWPRGGLCFFWVFF